MTKQFIAMVFLLAGFCGPASAFQKFEEYRIPGNEIRAVRVTPPANEDPATIVIELDAEAQNDRQIILESDNALDDCKATVESAIGDEDTYVEIVLHTTANTMNGVIVVECLSLTNR